MTSILISVAAKIAEYLVEPILRQFGYLINFNKNVNNLTQQAQKLKKLKLQVKQAAEQATRNGEVVEPKVQMWLASVDEIINEVEEIEEESKMNKSCIGGWCPNCFYRYPVSRKSTKKVVLISGLLQEKGNFHRISHPPPLAGIEYSSSKDFILFESRKSTMDQILDALGEDESSVVVLHGIRGVGKTALAKEVGMRAKEQNMFDEVVMAVVSKTPDYVDIQGQLADMLSLKLKEESEMGRARRLYQRLKNDKKILIILDDVWARPDLGAIGIPSALNHKGKGCKILITNQNENIWRTMGDGTKKVELKVLLEEESWSLFRSVTGEIVDTPTFKLVAKEIVRKCKGLPLLLVAIGKKLRHKGIIEEWKDVSREIGDLETNTANLDDLLDGYV